MASSTLKTQFSPYIAQLGMPSKGMLSAFGDAVDEYELDKRKDILFGIQEKKENAILDKTNFDLEQARIRAPFENESKELDVKSKRFEVDELNPLKKTTEQNRANSTALELGTAQYIKDNGGDKAKLDTLLNQQKVANINATYAEEEKKLDIGNKKNTQKLSALKLEDASSDDIIKKTASFFYTDSNGDGIIDEKDFAMVQKELKNNPNIPPEKLNEAYMYAKERVTKINEVESRIEKNTNVNLGIDNSTKAITAARDYGTQLAKKHGLKSESDLATIDITTLNDSDKAELQSWADQYVKASGKKDIIQKEMAGIAQQQGMLKQVGYYVDSAIKKGNDVNFATTAINKLGAYLGDEVTFDKELAAKNSLFQSVLNTQLKIQSGTAVTQSEYDRFLKEASTLYESNPKMITALQTMAFKQMEQLKALKEAYAYDPVFNVRYGKIYKNAENLLSSFEKIGAVDKEQAKPQFKGYNRTNQASRSKVDLQDSKYF